MRSLKVYALALRYLMALADLAADFEFKEDLLNGFASIIADMELEAKK